MPRQFAASVLVMAGGILLVSSSLGVAEIHRVTETREQDGKTRLYEEPIKVEKENRKDEGDRHLHFGGPRGRVTEAPIGAMGATGASSNDWGDPEHAFAPARFVQAGYSLTHVHHKLTTRFDSPTFTTLRWNTVPTVHGKGAEIAFHPLDLDFIVVGVRGGFFEDTTVGNAQQEGGYYVREHVRTVGGWANFEAQTEPFWGLSVLAGIGGFTYSVHTHVDTNAPAYRYEGLSGSRNLFLAGLGGQFETPWRFPLKLFAQGRYWWTAGAGDPLESGVNQFSTGLIWRF